MTHGGEAKPPQRYCGNCGAQVSPSDSFCGVCGNRIVPSTPEDPQVIPKQTAAAQGAEVRSGRRSFVLVAVVGIVLVLLVGGSVIALVQGGLGPGVSPSAPPDPSFDPLLPTLRGMTDAPIMLPAKLPDELDMTAIDGYLSESEDGYGIVFSYGPTEKVAQEVSMAETLGTLRAYPEGEDVANEYFDAESIEEIDLPDGTEATLRYMVPAGRVGSQGPFWEGKFDKAGYTYVLTVVKPDEIAEDDVEQTLSTMVEVE